MAGYEHYLKSVGVCPNTSSFYMRGLRAIYNRAVEKGLTQQRNPFRHVYTGDGDDLTGLLPWLLRVSLLSLPAPEMPDRVGHDEGRHCRPRPHVIAGLTGNPFPAASMRCPIGSGVTKPVIAGSDRQSYPPTVPDRKRSLLRLAL